MTNEINLAENVRYLDCIRKAYIDPIRTATVIDDKYPAAETIAIERVEREYDPVELARLSALIKLCRSDENSWGLEVSDGKTESSLAGRHINNSDLVVLDYDIENDADTAGEKARQCISMLANNHHFNLVIVHTGGYEGDLKKVFEEILVSLKTRSLGTFDKEQEIEDFLQGLRQDNPELVRRIERNVDIDAIIDISGDDKSLRNLLHSPESPYRALKDELIEIAREELFEPTDIIFWMLNRQLNSLEGKFSSSEVEQLDFCWKSDSMCWISSNRFFLTVVKKSNDPDDISKFPKFLVDALANSKPSPMLLLMAKIRNEMEEHGFKEAIKIDGESNLQAAWLKDLLDSENYGLYRVSDKLVKNHWESIAYSRASDLNDFVIDLSDALSDYKDDIDELVKALYKDVSNDKKERIAEMNRYACSMHSDNQRLSIGLIICLPSENPDLGSEPWVVLSPACDLEPREQTGWAGRIGVEVIPFKACKLERQTLGPALTNVNRDKDEYVFLRGESENCAKAYRVEKDWEQMFALNLGSLNDDGNLDIVRLAYDQDNVIGTSKVVAKVFGQLRYEYALNLLQKLGTKLSRIGLDFSSY